MYLINNLPTTLQLLQGTISIPPLGHLKISDALVSHLDVNYAVYQKGWATLSELPPGDVSERESQAPTMKLSEPDQGMTIKELRELQEKEEAEKEAAKAAEEAQDSEVVFEQPVVEQPVVEETVAETPAVEEVKATTRRGRQAK